MSSTDTKKLKNKAPKKPYKESKWLKTHENWAPSFEKGETQHWINPDFKEPNPYKLGLLASLSELPAWSVYPRLWRVSVWGGDDFGMDIDFESKNEAKALYHGLPKEVHRSLLEGLGLKMF